ncbi:MAG: peroxiredoxin family protein [Bryobacteraceae bacterium]|nr:peroxiredoxin family protein [Bryobacteraceae bacterium]
MENEKQKFEKQGMKVAAISFDSPGLLAEFASRRSITYPLLSDQDSRVIRAFDLLNEEFPKDHVWFGAPHPGTFVLNAQGVVTAKYFEADYRERYTAATVYAKSFSADRDSAGTAGTPHLTLRYSASGAAVRAGSRVQLTVDVELKPEMHVYAPGVQPGYKPIEWELTVSEAWQPHPVSFPKSRTLRLEAIQESVPAYQGRFTLTRDVTIGPQAKVKPALSGSDLLVQGEFRYQACNDRECFPPRTVPLEWKLRYESHVLERSPAELQRKKAAR